LSKTQVLIEYHPSGLYLEVDGFPGVSGWKAGFTTRLAEDQMVRLLSHLGWQGLPVFRPTQRHGGRVLVVRDPRQIDSFPQEADGLATACRGAVLAVAAADCVPLILFDPARSAGAVLHAGWRGTLADIAREGICILENHWGCRPGDIRALLGPCIGPCCYQVGPEVVQAFEAAGHPVREITRNEGGAFFLNLPAVNRRTLEAGGLRRENITWVELCTRCRPDLFPSYRREGPRAGRLLGFLGSSLRFDTLLECPLT